MANLYVIAILAVYQTFFLHVHGSHRLHANSPQTYDFIVGAGSAGAVVANRLTENKDVSVLLLEAGRFNKTLNYLSEIPAGYLKLLGSLYDWDYHIEPQEYASFGYQDRINKYPRGKALGGSSAINFMKYIRGNKRDYNNWAAMGNDGWNFDDVLPYFKKSEDNRDATIASNKKYHSTGGYLTVSSMPEQPGTGIVEAFLLAANRANLPTIDINAERQTGITTIQNTIRDGLRCSTEKAFLRPAAKRPNLTIVQNAFVTKILVNKNKQAYGVIYETSRVAHQVLASKEVIVSCGTINTPQLLLLSGIGGTKQLNKFGIPVVSDVEGVGENLNDHVGTLGMSWILRRSRMLTFEKYKLLISFVKWFFMGRGIPVQMDAEAILFLQTKYESEPDWPDIQAVLTNGNDINLASRRYLGISAEANNRYFIPQQNETIFRVTTQLLRPKSRGYVRINSADPYDKPLINPRYFSHPNDITVLAEGMRRVVELAQSSEMQLYGTTFYAPSLPGCGDAIPQTLAYYECNARFLTRPGWHPVGTSKMAPLDRDPMAVVGPDLRVRGVSRLRVIDASIMPTVVTGNINAASIMIGEKGADLVKATWNI